MEILQPQVGDRVRVRQRTWVVQDVDGYESCRILTLSGRTNDGTPQTVRFVHPFDDVESAGGTGRPRRVGIRAWRHACRALIAADGPVWAIRTAAAARILLLPYQLEPAMALLRGLGCRLLIADEVGLGKTVQAMLAVAELRARGAAARVLIVCPAGLRDQWAEECTTRFDLPVTILDQAGLRQVRAALPVGVNPWTTEPLVVASVDFVKRPEVLPALLAANWDVVVVDEAHSVSGESDRRQAVSRLCRRAPYVLLLTATPHNGDEAAFASLCDLGRLDEGLVVFRRSRLEAGRDAGRRVHTLRVRLTDAERRMHAALRSLTRAVRQESADLDRNTWLILSVLHKRALSSPFALAASAERRLRLLADGAGSQTEQLFLLLDDGSGDEDRADDAPMWGAPALRDSDRERQLLRQVVEAARQAEGSEGKLVRLRRLLESIDEPVIVFTEYRDTLLHVRNQVAPDAAVIHGGMAREQRRAALRAFPSAGVLLATDAAGEGLNLHQHCRAVINLELPWNPMRLEQRIGRVDRIGQQRRVHVFHLVSRGTGEARLLHRLAARVSQANARVGAPNPLCGRPEWTEQASARLIVLGDTPIVEPRGDNGGPAVALTRIEPEARCESVRVQQVRTLGLGPPGISAVPRREGRDRQSSVAVTHTRRHQLRAILRGRALAVFRTSVSDASGRNVSTRIDGALCDSSWAGNSSLVQGLSQATGWVAARQKQWREESLAAHARMLAIRLHRARAIAALFREAHAEQQPGLFDRRVEQQWQECAEEETDARDYAAHRVARAEAARDVSVSAPELALVLVPGRTAGSL